MTAGEDFVSVNKSLLFGLGFGLIQCVHIPILADECLEATENFTVELSVDHIGVGLALEEITVSIVEDDGGCIPCSIVRYISPNLSLCSVTKLGLEELEYDLMENENMNVCVIFDRKLEKPISISYSLENMAAFGEAVYNSPPLRNEAN